MQIYDFFLQPAANNYYRQPTGALGSFPLTEHTLTECRTGLLKTVAARGFVSGRGPLNYGLADANSFADDRTEGSGRDSAFRRVVFSRLCTDSA